MSDTTDTMTTATDPVVRAVIAALARVLRRDESGISPETRLFQDLGLDSTTVLELLMDLESEIDIELDADTLEQEHFETVASLAEYVRSQLSEGDA